MGLAERRVLIEQIQQKRESTVVTYVTGTRHDMDFPMAMDAVRRLYDHLHGQYFSKLDLFIHSNGGEGVVPWRLVTLLREHCKTLAVLVPYRAFSAATLLALGADEIVMHPMGMLGPTDPTVANAFNPRDEDTGRPIGIGVEDLGAFIAIAKDDLALTQEGQVRTMEMLATQVHPLALGNVKRSQAQSKMMAQKLLALHMDAERERTTIEGIIDSLTSKLYYHGHPINRSEAAELGLKAAPDVDDGLEDLMWELYLDYERDMQLGAPFRAVDVFLAHFPDGAEVGKTLVMPKQTFEGVRIESMRKSHCFSRDVVISGQKEESGAANVSLYVHREGWREDC